MNSNAEHFPLLWNFDKILELCIFSFLLYIYIRYLVSLAKRSCVNITLNKTYVYNTLEKLKWENDAGWFGALLKRIFPYLPIVLLNINI